jgi:hypothetical protein
MPNGYRDCSTFYIKPGKLQFAHMFLRWVERTVEDESR